MSARWLYVAVSFFFATLAALGFAFGRQQPAPQAGHDGERESPTAITVAADDEIKGLWTRWPHEQAGGDRVRFYYFHGDGLGLYRYGKIGHTNTNSYRYRVLDDGADGRVELSFNKTGERYRVPFRVKMGRDGRRVLRLEKDPRENGAPQEYFYVPPPPGLEDAVVSADPMPPSGRMWICMRRYETGGQGFELYQFTPAGIDGRGTGWHHKGDFDDWSTEALTYRIENQRLQMRFELTGERSQTGFALAEGQDGGRRLLLADDPRNFWHGSRFLDMGKSFSLHEPGALWRLGQLAADGGLPTCR